MPGAMTDQTVDLPAVHPNDLLARRPTGAPNALDRIVAYDNGIPVTAEDRVLAALRVPMFQHEAADAAGIERQTLAEWKNRGAAANRKKAEGKHLSATETRYADFANAMIAAEGEGRMAILSAMTKVGVGGYEIETITEKRDADDKLLERTVRKQTAEPNPTALAWFAERRWAKDWNRRQQIEVSGPEGGPIQVESPLAVLMATLDAMDRRQRAIDTASREATVEIPADTITEGTDDGDADEG